ncbi:MAG TPA: MarR family transcriptional regulator [Candidatus Acidoferrales bacterium]|jgi:DNA-binding MarR family transcriptional regulator|nr:MarR family transcriptional regulator [Candidatus Acidoferrales bacterium]
MTDYITPREKTQRAFRAYVDLMDAGDWIKGELRGPLMSFDLAMGEFRLLELLYREGALFVSDIARKRGVHRAGVEVTIARLARRGWVGQRVVALPPVEPERAHLAKSRRGERREGRRIRAIGLTKSGKKFIGNVLPSHSKVVKAMMRALDGREQETLSRLCRKLREGDASRFLREMRMMDEDQEAAELAERATAELERLRSRGRLRSRKF